VAAILAPIAAILLVGVVAIGGASKLRQRRSKKQQAKDPVASRQIPAEFA
jgi:hypothetical protein